MDAVARAQIPQPEGWGSFTLAYKGEHESTNPPTGRLGIFHASLQSRTQAYKSANRTPLAFRYCSIYH